MYQTVIGADETPEALAVRTERPLCSILRANRLYSTAWLMPGMLVQVPDAQFCARDAFPCLYVAMRAPAMRMRMYALNSGETVDDAARAMGITPRMVYAYLNCTGEPLPPNAAGAFPEPPERLEIITVMPGDTFLSFCAGEDELALRALNALWGPVYPGMKLIMLKHTRR